MVMKYLIVAADTIVDGIGSHLRTDEVFSLGKDKKFLISELEIVSLAKRWEDKLSPNQFKSGASAMSAIKKAQNLLETKKANVVVIKGEDFLRTGYSKDEREKYMKLYKNKFTPLDGYTKLVTPFIRHHGMNEKEFLKIRDLLFENYLQTWTRLNPEKKRPDERWFAPLTKYFRGVDCANPNIDYSGRIIITDKKHADLLAIPTNERVKILGNAFTKLSVDGFESIPKIAPYLHLAKVINNAQYEAKINFASEFKKERAFLEAYTCYPIVPMALILKMGLVKHFSDIPEFLKNYEVTITGGLNLAKAPWNLTSLNYIIEMRKMLLSSKDHKYGLVHGNGSLGNQQGITILGK